MLNIIQPYYKKENQNFPHLTLREHSCINGVVSLRERKSIISIFLFTFKAIKKIPSNVYSTPCTCKMLSIELNICIQENMMFSKNNLFRIDQLFNVTILKWRYNMIVNRKPIKRNYAEKKEYLFENDGKIRHENNTN